MYILTGCDTVSYPFNKGKKRALAHMEDLSTLRSIGEPENERYLTEEIFSAVCRLLAFLYEREYFEGSADELRAYYMGISEVICFVCHLQKTR